MLLKTFYLYFRLPIILVTFFYPVRGFSFRSVTATKILSLLLVVLNVHIVLLLILIFLTFKVYEHLFHSELRNVQDYDVL